ncbi:YqzL family protein [Paenibacillus sp. sgz302251]|uniref:YqzL family protein n=1 Tax=Paenibacillus sp. sgz302251 TaxID=3414493 RepID=UPI003C7DAB4A
MRDFSWKYFALTGDVESFMLYKEINQFGEEGRSDTSAMDEEQTSTIALEDSTS